MKIIGRGRFCVFFSLLLLLTSCNIKIKSGNHFLDFGREKKEKILFRNKKFCRQFLYGKQKTFVSFFIPVAYGSEASENINNSVLTAMNVGPVYQSKVIMTYDELMDNFIASYKKFVKDFPDYRTGWEWTVQGRIAYFSSQLLNLRIDSYSFTGGAHGNSYTASLLYNPSTGDQLENEDILKDSVAFKTFAEKQFRRKFDIREGRSINSTGFSFPDNRFVLPENIFFTQEGIVLYYNDMEIAPHIKGPQELFLPYDEVMVYLKINPLL